MYHHDRVCRARRRDDGDADHAYVDEGSARRRTQDRHGDRRGTQLRSSRRSVGDHRMIRSIGAVFAGILVNFMLSLGTDVVLHSTGVFPGWGQPMSDGLFAVALAYRLVYTVLGGYLTARLAPANPMKHVMILGIIGIVLGTAGAVGTWNK